MLTGGGTVELIVSSTMLAGVYALSALSWVLLYRTTGLFNLATGQFLLLGSYLFFELAIRGIPFFGSLLVASAAVVVIGLVVYWLTLRRMTGEAEFTPMALTLGLGAVLAAVASVVWGPANRVLPEPIPNELLHLPGDITVTVYGVAIVVTSLLVFALVTVITYFLPIGVAMRATAENPVLAGQTGIPVDRTLALGWCLSLVAATFAGVAYSYLNVLSPLLADHVGLLGLAPALIGGLDSIPGALIGSLVVALSQTFGVAIVGGGAQDAIAWGLLLAFLIIRPYGIMGSPKIERV